MDKDYLDYSFWLLDLIDFTHVEKSNLDKWKRYLGGEPIRQWLWEMHCGKTWKEMTKQLSDVMVSTTFAEN